MSPRFLQSLRADADGSAEQRQTGAEEDGSETDDGEGLRPGYGEGRNQVTGSMISGWLSIGVRPPESVIIGTIVMIISSANCAIVRAMAPRKIPIAAANS